MENHCLAALRQGAVEDRGVIQIKEAEISPAYGIACFPIRPIPSRGYLVLYRDALSAAVAGGGKRHVCYAVLFRPAYIRH